MQIILNREEIEVIFTALFTQFYDTEWQKQATLKEVEDLRNIKKRFQPYLSIPKGDKDE